MNHLIIAIGLPASGKSTHINKFLQDPQNDNFVVVSSDDIIEQYAAEQGLTYNESFRLHSKVATAKFWDNLKRAIKNGCDVIVDRTNLTKDLRRKIIAHQTDYNVIGWIFGTELDSEEHQRRLDSRHGKTIPPHVIASMRTSYEQPTIDEGFDQIVDLDTYVIMEKL